MSSDIERVIQRDLDQLPLLPAERWVPAPRPRTALGARVLPLMVAGVVVVAAVVAGNALARVRSDNAIASPSARASGVTFERVGALPLTAPATPGRRILASPGATPGRLFASVPDDARLFGTSDGGRTWSTIRTPATGDAIAIALARSMLVVADRGRVARDTGRTAAAAIHVSNDDAKTWTRARGVDSAAEQLLSSVIDVFGFEDPLSGPVFLAASVPQPLYGAATATSEILASLDGVVWKHLGTMPGPAVFGAADVPVVSFIKNDPRSGISRVEGKTLADLKLVPVVDSQQAWSLYRDPNDGSLWQWSINSASVRHSTDLGLHWTDTAAPSGTPIGGFFSVRDAVFGYSAIGPGTWRWDGAHWQDAPLGLPQIIASADGDGFATVLGADGTVWRSR